jgi:hypothetical protein
MNIYKNHISFKNGQNDRCTGSQPSTHIIKLNKYVDIDVDLSLYDHKIMINLKTNYYVQSIYRTLLAEIYTQRMLKHTNFTQFLLLKYHKPLTKLKITSHVLHKTGRISHKLNRIK